MDKFALQAQGRCVGEVRVTEQGLYRHFHAQLFHMDQAIHWVYLQGAQGTMRLGVLEKSGDGGTLVRRISKQMLSPFGPIVGFVLDQEDLLTPWVAISPGDSWWNKLPQGTLTKQTHTRRLLALAYQPKKPFALMGYFCFCKPMEIDGAPYLVLTLDQNAQVVVQ